MKNENKKQHGIFWAIGTSILLQLLISIIYSLAYTITRNIILSYLFGYLFTLIILIFIFKDSLRNDLKNIKEDISDNKKSCILSFIIGLLLVYTANIILYKLFGTIADNEELIRSYITNNPLIMFLPICLFGPIIEEIAGRYPYKNIKTNRKLSFIVYTTIFALLHLSITKDLIGLLYIIPYWFLSASFGYSFYKTNNIFTSIFFHILNNTFTYILILIGG